MCWRAWSEAIRKNPKLAKRTPRVVTRWRNRYSNEVVYVLERFRVLHTDYVTWKYGGGACITSNTKATFELWHYSERILLH